MIMPSMVLELDFSVKPADYEELKKAGRFNEDGDPMGLMRVYVPNVHKILLDEKLEAQKMMDKTNNLIDVLSNRLYAQLAKRDPHIVHMHIELSCRCRSLVVEEEEPQ